MNAPLIILICDLQFGSTGKGLIAGKIANDAKVDTVVTSNMPNAGHTFIDADGIKYVNHVIGNGSVAPSVKRVMVGPGSVFNIQQLIKEVELARSANPNFKVLVHENAWVQMERHKSSEQVSGINAKIGSTAQGAGAALLEKIQRDEACNASFGSVVTEDEITKHMIIPITQSQWVSEIKNADRILVEGSQGYSLGLNAGFWPYSTSRDCTPARIMADCGIPLLGHVHVVGTARVHPIRVGGNSGPGYSDQTEISWDELGVTPERTTTTNRERRVFTFSKKQILEAIDATQACAIFLNFMNYNPIEGMEIAKFINANTNTRVEWFGFGPKVDQVYSHQELFE